MGKLGDFFPGHEKQKHVAGHLEPGQVLCLFCEFTTPQKDKYLVLACPGERSLFFVINSQIPEFAQARKALRSCQIKLSVSDYPFLDHDSYANCAEVRVVSKAEIERQLLNDVGRIKGKLNATTRKRIVKVVQSAKTISKEHKKLIVEALK